jgi:flagellar biosynthesis GTPase FlhF
MLIKKTKNNKKMRQPLLPVFEKAYGESLARTYWKKQLNRERPKLMKMSVQQLRAMHTNSRRNANLDSQRAKHEKLSEKDRNQLRNKIMENEIRATLIEKILKKRPKNEVKIREERSKPKRMKREELEKRMNELRSELIRTINNPMIDPSAQKEGTRILSKFKKGELTNANYWNAVEIIEFWSSRKK